MGFSNLTVTLGQGGEGGFLEGEGNGKGEEEEGEGDGGRSQVSSSGNSKKKKNPLERYFYCLSLLWEKDIFETISLFPASCRRLNNINKT